MHLEAADLDLQGTHNLEPEQIDALLGLGFARAANNFEQDVDAGDATAVANRAGLIGTDVLRIYGIEDQLPRRDNDELPST